MHKLIRGAAVRAAVAGVTWALIKAESDAAILMASQFGARIVVPAVAASARWVGASQAGHDE